MPGVEVVGGVEQRRYNSPDCQVEIATRGVSEPHRFEHRAQIAFDVERLFQHRLDGLRPELEDVDVADHEVQALDTVRMTGCRHKRAGFLDCSLRIRLVAEPLVALLFWRSEVREW